MLPEVCHTVLRSPIPMLIVENIGKRSEVSHVCPINWNFSFSDSALYCYWFHHMLCMIQLHDTCVYGANV